MAFAIYGSSQLFCVVWQVMLLASFAVITYAYLRIEEQMERVRVPVTIVITYAYLRIEEMSSISNKCITAVITYAYLRIEERILYQSKKVVRSYNLRISAD